jgi:hypothetical protein
MENGKWKMENLKTNIFRSPFSVFRFSVFSVPLW